MTPVFGGEQPALVSAMGALMATNRGVSGQPYQSTPSICGFGGYMGSQCSCYLPYRAPHPPFGVYSTVSQSRRHPILDACVKMERRLALRLFRTTTRSVHHFHVATSSYFAVRVRTYGGRTSSPLNIECHLLIFRAWLESSTTTTVDDDHIGEAANDLQPNRSSAHGSPVAQ